MIRVTRNKAEYIPVKKYNDERYRIAFDMTDNKDNAQVATWSLEDYFIRPTTEQVQNDVKELTIKRYINEGLTPPAREDIDVSEYVID